MTKTLGGQLEIVHSDALAIELECRGNLSGEDWLLYVFFFFFWFIVMFFDSYSVLLAGKEKKGVSQVRVFKLLATI